MDSFGRGQNLVATNAVQPPYQGGGDDDFEGEIPEDLSEDDDFSESEGASVDFFSPSEFESCQEAFTMIQQAYGNIIENLSQGIKSAKQDLGELDGGKKVAPRQDEAFAIENQVGNESLRVGGGADDTRLLLRVDARAPEGEGSITIAADLKNKLVDFRVSGKGEGMGVKALISVDGGEQPRLKQAFEVVANNVTSKIEANIAMVQKDRLEISGAVSQGSENRPFGVVLQQKNGRCEVSQEGYRNTSKNTSKFSLGGSKALRTFLNHQKFLTVAPR